MIDFNGAQRQHTTSSTHHQAPPTDRSAEEIAAALGGKRMGKGWQSSCPAHDDKNASFSISQGANGVLVHCHAGCGQEDVLDALRKRSLWPERRERATASTARVEVASYNYTDRDGKLIFQVVRYLPKDFRQRRPDGKDGWIPSQGDRRVLYRWPDLVKFPDATLFVCEGEKDADKIASLGLCATTVANGNWNGVDVLDVAGRDVIVLEDADTAGVKKARNAATILRAVAATVRIVRLPGHEHTAAKHGKDVSDWLDGDPSRAAKLAEVCFDATLWDGEDEAEHSGLDELDLDKDPVAVAKDLAALIAARRDVLLNGYVPVRVVAEFGQEPCAIEITVDSVRTYAHEICLCTKSTKKGGRVEVPLPRDVAQLYRHGFEGQRGLRPLNGISTSPLLGAGGIIRAAAGYDEATGLWCHNIPVVTVPEVPTKEDAQAALVTLRRAFETFPFADAAMTPNAAVGVNVVDLGHAPQLDESTHLVMLMTAVCRPCLPLTPGFLYNASLVSGAGTGKGLAVKGGCIIGSGAAPHAMSAGHNAEELDKRLVSAAIEARPAIFLDNFNEGTLESDTLASFLTESPARVRVFGHSKTVPLNTRALVVVTGNSVTISEDMARRILLIGLDAGMENPEQRPFAPGFLQGIMAQRPALLSACLTIWRWGVQQGDKLPRGKPIGSYEQWAIWCRDPLLALGCRDPIERLAMIKAADPRRRQLVEVFHKWWEQHRGEAVSAADLHAAVKEAIDPDAKRGGDGELFFSRQKVAAFLRKHANTRAGGFHLTAETRGTSAAGHEVARYRLRQGG